MVTGRSKEHSIFAMRFSAMINQSRKKTDELHLLSAVDLTSRLEYDLLDTQGAWQLEDEDKKDPGRSSTSRRRRRLSFSLAVRKGRFARYSLLIGSRYGVWSAAERRFIKRTNFYHYHHITQGIRDVRMAYSAVILDGFYGVRSTLGFLCKLLVNPRRAVRIMRALLFYYHVFMAKDRRMECWPTDVHGKDRRDELSSVRHRLVDVYQRRMTPAQRQRVLVIYERHSRDLRFALGFILLVPLVLFVIIAWLLKYCW
ncbi:uncharacterized protein [Lolium perenne]|uniref:uncharacterized protein n=1 Tax=Lolium perenne TaxID=4522 RepID=UPI0021F58C32|nr:uncharacterized protein LOC127312181 [Lolium perenne]